MVGDLTVKATGKKIYCDTVLDVQADNLASMIDLDPEHTMNVKGTVTCSELSKESLAAEGRHHYKTLRRNICLFILMNCRL